MDLNHDNDWHRYFGDSTIHTVGRHGYAVRLPRDSKSGEKDRERIQTETQGGSDAVREGLAEDPGDDET